MNRTHLKLIDDFTAARIDRVAFTRRAIMLGLSLPVIQRVLGADEPATARATDDDEATPQAGAEENRVGEFGGQLNVVLNNAGTGTLDVVNARHTKSGVFARLWSDFLVHIDPESEEVVDGLAEEWSVSEDGLIYTFKLKNGITFHDGTPFNAEAVKSNIDAIADAQLESYQESLGGDRYEETKVVDDLTVEVVFNEPFATFLQAAAGGLWFDSPAAKEQYGEDYGINIAVGPGPYRVVDRVANSHCFLERYNEYQWGSSMFPIQGRGYLERIEIRGIPEAGTRRSVLDAGEADVVMLDEGDVPFFQEQSDFEVHLEPKAGTSRQLRFNLDRPILQDIAVRQAISHAIDREGLLLAPRYSGIGQVSYMPLGRKNFGNAGEEFMPSNYLFDPDQAALVLEEAGWILNGSDERTKDGERLELEIIFPTDASDEVQPLQPMLAEVGIELKLTALQTSQWFAEMDAGNFDFTIGSNSGAGLGLLSDIFGPDNDWGYSNPEFDGLVGELATTGGNAERQQIVTEMQHILLQDAVVIPLIDVVYPFGHNVEVQGIFYPISSWPIFYPTWIDQSE